MGRPPAYIFVVRFVAPPTFAAFCAVCAPAPS